MAVTKFSPVRVPALYPRGLKMSSQNA